MKYIDADKLIAEIERLKERAEHYNKISLTPGEKDYWSGESGVLELLTSFITSLQQEQPTKGYDESYLNKCIAKASKTWENVDVDKYMDEVRGREQEQPEVDLEHIENDAELITNKIMIGVQANKYHTCVYNTERNDFNHSHLVQAARKGIELGLKARKEE